MGSPLTEQEIRGCLSRILASEDFLRSRGPHLDVFAAASHAQLGEAEQARELIAQMQQKYPGFPCEAWLERWLRDTDQPQQTLTILRELGLNPG